MVFKRILRPCLLLSTLCCCVFTVLMLLASGTPLSAKASSPDSDGGDASSRLAMGIFVDSLTYEACKMQILTYKLYLEQTANLRVSVIVGHSDRPSYWKRRIKELYEE